MSLPFAAGRPKALRPKDAATLLLLDRSDGRIRVLMGKRHASLAFMADKYVFPGGRVDRDDAYTACPFDLPAEDAARKGAASSAARLRTVALAAIREMAEEAGILVARPGAIRARGETWQGFRERGLAPALGELRLVARAETPPGQSRRFDSRFFAAWHSPGFVRLEGDACGELSDLCWPTLEEAAGFDIPDITRIILEDLSARLVHDPDLRPGGPACFYRERRANWERHTI
ncbi:MAG: NUDIX hydrolase [Mesorhizobium amorphae]|nr:MAG: NUDIX hydrolase [Mesorhizobium amorphae]